MGARKISESASPTVQKSFRGALKKNRISSASGGLKCSGAGTTSRRTKENSSGIRAKQCSVRRSWSSVLLGMKCKQLRSFRSWNECCRKILVSLLCGRRKQLHQLRTLQAGAENVNRLRVPFDIVAWVGVGLVGRVSVLPETLIS